MANRKKTFRKNAKKHNKSKRRGSKRNTRKMRGGEGDYEKFTFEQLKDDIKLSGRNRSFPLDIIKEVVEGDASGRKRSTEVIFYDFDLNNSEYQYFLYINNEYKNISFTMFALPITTKGNAQWRFIRFLLDGEEKSNRIVANLGEVKLLIGEYANENIYRKNKDTAVTPPTTDTRSTATSVTSFGPAFKGLFSRPRNS